jgi:hydrogenase 3 maturation protease
MKYDPRYNTLTKMDHSRELCRLTPQLARWLRGSLDVVILGIGNSVRRDDFVGMVVVRRLERARLSHVHLIETGEVPESYLGVVENTHPTHVLIVDAAEMDAPVGSVKLVSPEKIAGLSLSTHALPLSVVSDYLASMTKAKIALLGIQPKVIGFGEGLSQELRDIVEPLSQSIVRAFELSRKKGSRRRIQPKLNRTQRAR